ncbi:MAG: hypothetical protein HKN21_00025 [Candidatus Eisenbacteria bacterium]|uniref:DinB family protein n=1 Tax=Eiseniibacteriota bacterium TaxID=2212470 RepID=A0A7Y2H0N4_UNCEI|nr:hypothetical protein [Candidatus Eisenbacteria bacterium]
MYIKTMETRLTRSFQLYEDLLDILEESKLSEKLPGLRSNSLGLQLWCVVGARESYSRAIEAGEWSGFSCSLESPVDQAAVRHSMTQSSRRVVEAVGKCPQPTEMQEQLLFDLLEHEVCHQGQLIRYLYGLGIPIPESWRKRYNLEP